jgi:N-acetylmuramic acid 6-phosphate etherase
VTPFARGALEAGRARGAATILLTCTDGRGLDSLADIVIALDTGPEILSGSTRLKAASATKAALNAITTAAMVRLGKTYENLMVDLRAGSAKLRDRARRIVSLAGRVPIDDAERLLGAAGGEVKTAVVMARLGVDAREARQRLAASDGHVWRALGESP